MPRTLRGYYVTVVRLNFVRVRLPHGALGWRFPTARPSLPPERGKQRSQGAGTSITEEKERRLTLWNSGERKN